MFIYLLTFLQKENEHKHKEQSDSESKHPELNPAAPTEPNNFIFSAASNLENESNPEHVVSTTPSTTNSKNQSMLTVQEDFCPSGSSLKRTFSDLERSPEPFEIRAKKGNAHYTRCYEIPEEMARFHTGLTGTFSGIQIAEFMASTEEIGLHEDRVPNRSSPIAVAKSLFCELEVSTEDVFEDGPQDLSASSFTSPLAGNSDICRSLSLDSDGSQHETSLIIDSHASLKQYKSSRNKKSASSEEQEECKDTSITKSFPKPQFAALTETPKLGNFGKESHCSSLKRLPDLACSVAQSPSFLKPRNVVAFRSYCSSINRSNMSGVSRLSIASLDAMDMSPAASYNFGSGNATPVQKRPNSINSLSQVIQNRLICKNSSP